MKNFFYLAVLMAAISCNSNAKEPDPLVQASKYKSHFGSDTVDVKLRKVTYNGTLLMEYKYANGYLTEFKKYVAFSQPRYFSTGLFTRNAGVPVKFDLNVAQIIPETEFVSEKQDPRSTIQYSTVKTDSTWELTEQNFQKPATFKKNYLFNKDGFVTKQTVTHSGGENYVVTYVRNPENNVSKTWKNKLSETTQSEKVDFVYDNKSNPFFKLGVDWQGEFSNYAISPNNPVQETIYNEQNRGVKSTYTYEYLPNGYPKKVTIVRGFINVDGIEEQTTPVVLEFEYY